MMVAPPVLQILVLSTRLDPAASAHTPAFEAAPRDAAVSSRCHSNSLPLDETACPTKPGRMEGLKYQNRGSRKKYEPEQQLVICDPLNESDEKRRDKKQVALGVRTFNLPGWAGS